MLILWIRFLNLFWEVCSDDVLLFIVCVLGCIFFVVLFVLYVESRTVIVIVGILCKIYFKIGWDLIMLFVFFWSF